LFFKKVEGKKMTRHPIRKMKDFIGEGEIKEVCLSNPPILFLIRKHRILFQKELEGKDTLSSMIQEHCKQKIMPAMTVRNFVETVLVIMFLRKNKGTVNEKKWQNFLEKVEPKEMINNL